MPSRRLPRLQLIAAAVLFSTGGAAIKSCTLSSWQIAGLRSVVAAVAMVLMLPAARRRTNARSIAVAVGYAATLILFVSANKLTTAASTIFLQSTAPLYIVLLGPLLLGEWMGRRDALFLAVLAVGLALLLMAGEPSSATAPDPLRGDLLAALSGVTWAFTVTGLRWIGRTSGTAQPSPLTAVLAGNLIVFLTCLPLALPIGTPRLRDWLLIGYLGVFQIGAAYMLVTTAIPYVPALEAALLLLLEPALNPVWAWLVHGERPGTLALCGGVTILLATAAKSWVDTRVLST
ncbi:MAG TPA: DMT family transporter [Candidatus Margulisiibacteriota bacterium]|nr:DMT family transporter [Candidatus Margulisiibacteriota bacterium]